MPNSQKIVVACTFDENNQLSIKLENNLAEQDQETRELIEKLADYTLDNVRGITALLMPEMSAPLLVISIREDYLANLRDEQAQYGDQGIRDNAVALAQTFVKVAAVSASEAAAVILTKNPAVGSMVGAITEEAYDAKFFDDGNKSAKDKLGDFVRDAFSHESSKPQISVESGVTGKVSTYRLTNEATTEGVFVAGAGSNIVQGDGSYNTYYFPDFSGQNIISNLSGGARLVLGDGAESVSLLGNAIPKTDANRNIIPDVWDLNGFELHKVGSDLVVIKAGGDIDDLDVGSITIKSFPFSQSRAFGISLGKIKDNGVGSSYSILESQAFNTIVFAAADQRGRFFSPVFDGGNFVIRIHDTDGFVVGNQKLAYGASTIGQCLRLPSENVAFIYGLNEKITGSQGNFISAKNSAWLAVTDADGLVISNQKLGEFIPTSAYEWQENQFAPSHVSTRTANDGSHKNYACFTLGGSRFHCGELSDVGDLVGSFGYVSNPSQFYGASNDYTVAFLPTDHKVTAASKSFSVVPPRYRDMTLSEIIPNYSIPSGSLAVTNPSIPKQQITFEQVADALAASRLKIRPAANTVTAVSGLIGSVGAKVDVSDFNLTPEEITTRITSTTQSEYSLEDILAGQYQASVQRKKLVNSTDEDYHTDDYYAANVTLPSYFDNPAKFTILSLPNNQVVVFTDISQQELAQNITQFLDLTAAPTSNPTQAQTGNPTGNPTLPKPPTGFPTLPPQAPTGNPTKIKSPSSLPSGQPSSQPSHHPTAGDLIMPSSLPSSNPTDQPSLKPFVNPSKIPSYQPSEIPSFNPRGNPSQQPTGEQTLPQFPSGKPSASPVVRPWQVPTNQPIYFIPTNEPSLGNDDVNGTYPQNITFPNVTDSDPHRDSTRRDRLSFADPEVYGPTIFVAALALAVGAYIVRRWNKKQGQVAADNNNAYRAEDVEHDEIDLEQAEISEVGVDEEDNLDVPSNVFRIGNKSAKISPLLLRDGGVRED